MTDGSGIMDAFFPAVQRGKIDFWLAKNHCTSCTKLAPSKYCTGVGGSTDLQQKQFIEPFPWKTLDSDSYLTTSLHIEFEF